MKKIFLLLVLPLLAQAQKIDKIITRSETERIETYLASDELAGRKPFTPGIEKAAQFISAEFEKAGLQKTNGSYLQSFPMYQSKVLSVAGGLDEQTLESKQVAIISKEATIQIDEKSGFEVASIKEGENFGQNAYRLMSAKKPTIAFLHESFAKYIPRLSGRGPLRENQSTIIFVVANTIPTKFKVSATQQVEKLQLSNVVGILPGKSRPNEYVIFSGHYDHLGIGKPVEGDSIYNGANDDGSGTVTVMELAEAFGKAAAEGKRPRRSILFMTVTGEEKGLLGSEWYANHPLFPLKNTVVDLNTDMTGRYDDEHKGKPDYIYEIGSDKLSSQLREVLVEQYKKHVGLELDYRYNDANDPNRFYYRSDHYNFAKHGIPVAFFFNGVHDDYHMPGDEVDKIEFDQIQKVGRLVFYMAWEIANREQRLVVDSNKP